MKSFFKLFIAGWVFIDADTKGSVNISAAFWHTSKISECSAVPTPFWRAPSASCGRSWLEAVHRRSSCGGSRPRVGLGGAWRRSRRPAEAAECAPRRLSGLTQNLSGCAPLCATTNKCAQQVLAERRESSVLWPFVMATRGLQLGEFPSLYLVRRAESLQPAALIMRAVSLWHQTLESQEAPRHGECAARLHPHVTAAIFHIKGHHLTLLSGRLAECYCTVVRMSTSSPMHHAEARWPETPRPSPHPPPTPSHTQM